MDEGCFRNCEPRLASDPQYGSTLLRGFLEALHSAQKAPKRLSRPRLHPYILRRPEVDLPILIRPNRTCQFITCLTTVDRISPLDTGIFSKHAFSYYREFILFSLDSALWSVSLQCGVEMAPVQKLRQILALLETPLSVCFSFRPKICWNKDCLAWLSKRPTMRTICWPFSRIKYALTSLWRRPEIKELLP